MRRAGLFRTASSAALLVGCGTTATFPEEPRDPQVFGEIVRVDVGEEPDFFVHVRGGLRTEVHVDESTILVNDTPDVGELYLAGNLEEGEDPWHAFLPPSGDCWVIGGPARRVGDRLLFVNGLRLRISDAMDWGPAGERAEYTDPRTSFCVDERGLVAAYLGPG